MGGKSMGRGWKGRACWAKMRAAVRVGGTEFSVMGVKWLGCDVEGVPMVYYLPMLWRIGMRPALLPPLCLLMA